MALHLTQLSFLRLTNRGRDLLAMRGMSEAMDMPSCNGEMAIGRLESGLRDMPNAYGDSR